MATGTYTQHTILFICSFVYYTPKNQADICLNFTTHNSAKKNQCTNRKFDIFVFCIFQSRKKTLHAARKLHCMMQRRVGWQCIILCAFCCKRSQSFHTVFFVCCRHCSPFQFDARVERPITLRNFMLIKR